MGLIVIAVVLVVGGAFAAVQAVQAHGRQLDPATFQAAYFVERQFHPVPAAPSSVVAAAAARVSGMRVVSSQGNVTFLNCRPNITRLDDGMGMFLRVVSTASGGAWNLRIEGQPKSRLAMSSDRRRGFLSIERQLRQAIAQLGHRVDDGLSAVPVMSAIDVPPRPPASPSVSPPPVAPPLPQVLASPQQPLTPRRVRAAVQHRDRSWAVDRIVLVGRNPATTDGGVVHLLRIEDPLLSKNHVAFHLDGDAVSVEDRGSTNGTLIRSGGRERVARSGLKEPVVDGDAVLIGDQQLTVRITEV